MSVVDSCWMVVDSGEMDLSHYPCAPRQVIHSEEADSRQQTLYCSRLSTLRLQLETMMKEVTK